MSMLAERRRKTRYVINPTKKPLWTTDNSGIKFGKELMEKMGWSAGKGLGANEQGIQEPLKVSYKNDNKGMGYKGNEENWIEYQDEFNVLLNQLSSNTDYQPNQTEKSEVMSLEEKSKHSKARVHYQKFTRGKDLSNYSENDLSCILGTGKMKKKDKVEIEEELPPVNNTYETSFGVTTINSGSINDYFKKKWTNNNHLKPSEVKEEESVQEEVKKHKKRKREESEEENTKVENEEMMDIHHSKKKKKKKMKEVDLTDEKIKKKKSKKEKTLQEKPKKKKKKDKRVDNCEMEGTEEESIRKEKIEESEEEDKIEEEPVKKKKKKNREVIESTEEMDEKEKKKKKKIKEKSTAAIPVKGAKDEKGRKSENTERGTVNRENGRKLEKALVHTHKVELFQMKKPYLDKFKKFSPAKALNLICGAEIEKFKGSNLAKIPGYGCSKRVKTEGKR